MIGICVYEDDTFIEFYPKFTDHRKFGFKFKSPIHFGCKRSGEYGIAWSRWNRMWTMWGNSAYPRNPISVLIDTYIVRRYKRWRRKK